MSLAEQFFMAAYYIDQLEWVATLEDIPCGLLTIAFDRTAKWLTQIDEENTEKVLYLRCHQSMIGIYTKINNKAGAERHRAEFEKWKQKDLKPYRPKKWLFDYWYAEAEKQNWEAMIVVSIFYHYGGQVRENARLSELWKKLARSTYNYYEPNGQPFDEVYADIVKEMTTDNSDESSTN